MGSRKGLWIRSEGRKQEERSGQQGQLLGRQVKGQEAHGKTSLSSGRRRSKNTVRYHFTPPRIKESGGGGGREGGREREERERERKKEENKQVLERTWRKWNPHALMVGM